MRALIEGETFIVTRNGQPIGELTPLRRHRFIRAAAPIDRDQLRHDLDPVASQDIAPRA